MGSPSYRLGHLRFTIEGEDPILADVCAELASLSCPSTAAPDLEIHFSPELPQLIHPIQVEQVRATEDAYEAFHNRLRYQLWRDESVTTLHVRSELSTWKHRLLPDAAARWRDRSFMTPVENAAKDFLYNVFDHVTQLAGHAKGQSYLHASSLTRGGNAVAFAAWGGVGKTSTVLHLLQRDGWQLLSDDLALVDVSGVLHPTPKRIQVYGYNLEGRPELRARVLEGRTLADRTALGLRSRIAGPHGVRRRMSPDQLFGPETVGKSAPLAYIALLRRAEVASLTVCDLAPAQLAHHAAVTLVRELRPFGEISTAIHSSVRTSAVPSPDQFITTATEILLEGLARAPAEMITIPIETRPEELGQLLESRIEANVG